MPLPEPASMPVGEVPLPEISTPSELAAHIQIPEGTLAQWRHLRKGPRYFKLGRHVRYRRADVEAWFEAQLGPLPEGATRA